MAVHTLTLLAWISLIVSSFIAYKVLYKAPTAVSEKVYQIGIIDMLGPFWDESIARSLFEQYGEEGRKWAADEYFDFPFCDCVFAVANSITLGLFLYINQPSRRWMCVVALCTGAFDIGENISISTLQQTFPEMDSLAMKLGPKITLAKYAFAAVSLLGILQGSLSSCYGTARRVKND